jgi:hypothetical protein
MSIKPGGRQRPPHPSDGSDPHGRELEVLIRIGADGRVYLHDITPDLLPIVLALSPNDTELRRRAEAAANFKQLETP